MILVFLVLRKLLHAHMGKMQTHAVVCVSVPVDAGGEYRQRDRRYKIDAARSMRACPSRPWHCESAPTLTLQLPFHTFFLYMPSITLQFTTVNYYLSKCPPMRGAPAKTSCSLKLVFEKGRLDFFSHQDIFRVKQQPTRPAGP